MPAAGLDTLCAQMAGYWERAITPWWERLVAALEEDVAHRARGLAAGGPLAAFADLHPRVRWRAGAVEVEHPYDAEVELAGRGLLLVPAAFVWPGLWAMLDPPWQPAIVYAPRGLGTLWEPPRRPRTAALDALLGRRRAPGREPGWRVGAPRRAPPRGPRDGAPGWADGSVRAHRGGGRADPCGRWSSACALRSPRCASGGLGERQRRALRGWVRSVPQTSSAAGFRRRSTFCSVWSKTSSATKRAGGSRRLRHNVEIARRAPAISTFCVV